MSPNCRTFIDRLNALNPAPDDYSFEATLYEVCELLKNEPDSSEAVPYVFQFFEKFPNVDHGSPGPLVHFLESCPEYQKELIASVKRKPTPHTVWMVNRILNSKLSADQRAFFIDLLLSVLTNPNSDETAKSEAEDFLKRQTSR